MSHELTEPEGGWEHGQGTGHELADQQPGLRDPGPPIVLVVTVDADGRSNVRYTTDPEWASATLRAIATGIDSDTIIG